jgi:hypothetical protein
MSVDPYDRPDLVEGRSDRMRRNATPAGRLNTALVCTLVALVTGLGAAGSATASGLGPNASVSKGKCKKKARWKCAAKRFHLSAQGFYKYYSGSQTFSAEIDLRKRRASLGEVDYTQESGTVTVSATATAESSDLLLGCHPVTYNVPQQKLNVPAAGLFDHDDLFLGFSLIGDDKNTYSLWIGDYLYQMVTLIQGSGTVTCDANASSAPFTFYFNGSARLITDTNPGKPWNHRLSGSGAYGGDSLSWTLTAK